MSGEFIIYGALCWHGGLLARRMVLTITSIRTRAGRVLQTRPQHFC